MDKPTKRELPVLLPTRGVLRPVIRALYSIKNFIKASILSLLILLIIFLLLSQMEQAYTMFLRMIESGKSSLLLCFILLNLLAVGLSHYPIYTYYAGNLNGSKKYVTWRKEQPYKLPLLNKINIYTFEPIIHPNYVKDIYSNILRQYLGFTLFLIWIHFIHSTYEPNLKYTIENIDTLRSFVYGIAVIPFILYLVLKRKLSRYHSSIKQRRKIYRKLGKLFFISSFTSLILLILVLINNQLFSQGGFLLLLLTTYVMMFNFVLFRLIRPRLTLILIYLKKQSDIDFSGFLKIVKPIESSTNYLIVFQISFVLSLLSIIYFNLASINDWILPNGIAIVLIYLYSFFYLISAIGKYYFVQFSLARKDKDSHNPPVTLNRKTFAYYTMTLMTIISLFVIGFFTETTLNELTIHPVNQEKFQYNHISIEKRMKTMSDTVYFVSSHGGGLKANTWTLLVLNQIQKQTEGKFIKQCISFSGASGGSLGLALYGSLYGLHGDNYEAISKKITNIRDQNYASIDISMLFGLDAIRIAYPFNQIPKARDRAYYGMIKYHNLVHGIKTKALNIIPFKNYWHKLQVNGNHLPALIMNTAATNGKRGVFCTLKINEFDSIFPYAKNLTDLVAENGTQGSISFYQAISTTNRFPIFSPVAKIKGYGHFIDAGAIDNSGILGNWDLYLYLRQKGILNHKTVIFVDIENSKTGYTEKILNTFLTQCQHKTIKKEENEKSAIIANLQTGLSLDKIPGYLTDFMQNYSSKRADLIYKQIFLPHKINVDDIETIIEGAIKEPLKKELMTYLDEHNREILNQTESGIGFWDEWETYEPVLSRHLSESNNTYFDKIIKTDRTGIRELVEHFKYSTDQN